MITEQVRALLRDAGFGDDYTPFYFKRDGALLLSVAKANNAHQRRRGLLGLQGLPPGVALYLDMSPLLHSLGMAFPIDVAWLRGQTIVKTYSHWYPGRPPMIAAPAWSCLELSAGQLEKLCLRRGDRIELEEAQL